MTTPAPWPSEADVERARDERRRVIKDADYNTTRACLEDAMRAALIAGAGPTVDALTKRVAELEAALAEARDQIAVDRRIFADSVATGGALDLTMLDDAEREGLDEYDTALAKIDAALVSAGGGT